MSRFARSRVRFPGGWSKVAFFATGPGSGVAELLKALRKFLFGGSRRPLSIDIYFKTLISVVFTESSGGPLEVGGP